MSAKTRRRYRDYSLELADALEQKEAVREEDTAALSPVDRLIRQMTKPDKEYRKALNSAVTKAVVRAMTLDAH